jgi:hypothetical protein
MQYEPKSMNMLSCFQIGVMHSYHTLPVSRVSHDGATQRCEQGRGGEGRKSPDNRGHVLLARG